MNVSPDIIQGLVDAIILGAIGIYSRAVRKLGREVKPTNGSTETLRSEVHTISVGMVSLHGKVDGLSNQFEEHIKVGHVRQ